MDATDDADTYRERWKYWLTQLMSTASAELEKRQARYKRNFDARLRLPGQQMSEGSVAVCRVNRGKVKLDALLSESYTRTWQCKDVPLICQRLHVDLLDTGYPVG